MFSRITSGLLCVLQVAHAAYELNCPVRYIPVPTPAAVDCAASGSRHLSQSLSIVGIDTPDIIVETVKLAEDACGQAKLVVRLYESAGGRVAATLQFGLPLVITTVTETNLLEKPLPPHVAPPLVVEPGNIVRLVFEPLQIKTIVVEFGAKATDAAAIASRL
eukprot:SAG31_NODE_8718_length_1400_cov_0.843966_1_plen_162_part_00